jgi:predicted esterase
MDDVVPVEEAQEFDAHLTDLGIDHEYLETDMGHCGDMVPVLSFMSEHLVSKEP